jgi:hypothetical protein
LGKQKAEITTKQRLRDIGSQGLRDVIIKSRNWESRKQKSNETRDY